MDFSDEMIDEILKIFQIESEEIISKMNNNLLDLERNPNNKDVILMLFRDAHSLKGASRMVGFNNVQTLAHKMEDVLGLAKENKISLNSNVVNVLYKTVDFLSEIIQKSIKKGQEIYSEEIAKHLAVLENINEDTCSVDLKSAQSDFNPEAFSKNIDKVHSLMPESLFLLMKLEANKCVELIHKLYSVISALYEIFNVSGPYDLKKMFEDMKFKLEFITKASNSLNMDEIEEFQRILNSVIEKLDSLCELYNIESVDYYSIAFEKISKGDDFSFDNLPQQVSDVQEEQTFDYESAVQPEFIEDVPFSGADSSEIMPENIGLNFEEAASEAFSELKVIGSKISLLSQNIGSASELREALMSFEKNCSNSDVKSVLQKNIEILNFAGKNEIQFNEEIISVLLQSLEYCENTLNGAGELADKELILQRLEIVQQILEFNKEKTEVEVFINPKEEKSKQIADFSEVFNTGSIKTLRVDSSKLDILVNQMNELTVSKIKTKKHLHELGTINQEIDDWQKNLGKVLNYLKYYDKKAQGFTGENSSFLMKQLLNVFMENNRKVQKISSNISALYRNIQEDDMKMQLVVDNLNNMVKNIRILPLATVFHLFGRMVRDIAQEKNKRIDFEILGSETSTDKKIIEEIKTPLIHIIRNAIDHGIEHPEERTAMGKNPVGKIVLSARQAGSRVLIEIQDDGRGINISKLKEKAIQKGFLTQEELSSMSDEQVTNLIFAPGFSTGDEITNISGRGIGLDVVQSKISQLNGKVSVVSEINKGCCVQIELPTAMSIVNVFLVESANQTFAIPIEAINTVIRKKEEEIIISNNKRSIIFNDKSIHLYDLSDILNLQRQPLTKDKRTILIIESGNKVIAMSVDKLIGEQEILHKKLSAPFYKLKNISGITTLISGEVCLILNIPDIMKTTGSLKNNPPVMQTKKRPNNDFKILVVDDSATTRTLEKNVLSKVGYNIETAEHPIEAFEKMKTIRFDLIISDVEMPEMNGIQFLEKLKTDEMFADIPVIMLSSLIDEEFRDNAIKLGAEKYISKGAFNQDDLIEAIGSILHRN